MFKLKKSRTFSWPVTVYTPDNGKHTKSTFTAIFRTLERDDFLARVAEFRDPDLDTIGQANKLAEFLAHVTAGVEGVEYDGESGDRETNQAVIIEALIGETAVASALFEAYVEGIAGKTRKN